MMVKGTPFRWFDWNHYQSCYWLDMAVIVPYTLDDCNRAVDHFSALSKQAEAFFRGALDSLSHLLPQLSEKWRNPPPSPNWLEILYELGWACPTPILRAPKQKVLIHEDGSPGFTSLEALETVIAREPSLREPFPHEFYAYLDMDIWKSSEEALRIILEEGETQPTPKATEPKVKRKRRRQSIQHTVPITQEQAAAVHLVGEHKGDFTAAGKAAGKSRQAMTKLYKKAMKKMGKTAAELAGTQALPRGARGQADVPDLAGPKLPARPRRDKQPKTNDD